MDQTSASAVVVPLHWPGLGWGLAWVTGAGSASGAPSFSVQPGQRFPAHSGGEWEVESTTERDTHSSADWWGLLTFTPGSGIKCHRHQIEGTDGFECLLQKTLAKRGKRNCHSSEAKSFYRSGVRNRPGTVRSPAQANALTHLATAPPY